jgi:hypothetical protein
MVLPCIFETPKAEADRIGSRHPLTLVYELLPMCPVLSDALISYASIHAGSAVTSPPAR